MVEGIAFNFSNEDFELFESIVKNLLQKENWSEKFSENYLTDLLQKLLAKALRDGNPNNIEKYLDEIITEFNNYSQEHIVYVPLVGIQMSMDELPVGKVVLKKMNETDVITCMNEIEKVVNSLKNTKEEKTAVLEIQQRVIADSLKNHICSVFKVVAEPQRASELAEQETRRVIDLLRFAIPTLYENWYNIAIGLQGEVVTVNRWILILSSDGKSFQTHQNRVGPLIAFEINEHNLEKMRKIGIFKISKVLEKHDREFKEFERVILRAVHWLANSQTQVESENKLFSLITCLETFLSPRDKIPIATYIAEAIAILIADDLENKRRLKKRVLELYGLRSAISHGGRKVLLDNDLFELENITIVLTMTLIDRIEEFESHKSLFDWIDTKKLGGL